jgi:phosphoglycerol transferase MdoB-like AlkP superfamily enzyme
MLSLLILRIGPRIEDVGPGPRVGMLLKNHLSAATADWQYAGKVAILITIHLAALGVLYGTEDEVLAQAAYVFIWGFLNFFWLTLLRRPVTSGALSLMLIVILILLSQFKHSITIMTITFADVLIIDVDTIRFLLTIIPGLAWKVGLAVALAIPALVLLWRLDPFRIPRLAALAGCMVCFCTLTALSLAEPTDGEDEFYLHQYVSKFARSGAVSVVDLITKGVLEADASVSTRLDAADAEPCKTTGKLPHIVMVFDESSFDATMMPNVKVPPNYHERFRSGDGKTRSFVVEGAGGPSWYTEYNVLAGLSVRSYGHFKESVTRIATGRVQRSLPFALRKCGYKTYSLYSWFGAFVGARGFHTTTGIEHFLDSKQLGTGPADTDAFFYNHAARVIAKERSNGPLFVFVYLATNHFPWNYRYLPGDMPEWKDLGNGLEIDEYLRRQQMSVRDYADFKQRLAREFPDEQFLLVRFGDHQPFFAKRFLEPGLDEPAIARRIQQMDPRYFTTYYTFEGLNFQPRNLSSALDPLDAPYLPLVVLEGAGVPLDPSFREQKRIMQRCNGMFYLCADGAEARRFNRLLINAGLIRF